jgi:hypothetical protein
MSCLVEETLVIYRNDNYLVRNNGQIFRKERPDKRKRPRDNQWTFGTPCNKSGYMRIGSMGVHQVIATAFHGEKPSPEHVVDHIDTDRRNNRPENLRWVTRQENIEDNPKTYQRILNKWGSIEALLADPNPSKKTAPLSNRPWMWQEEIINEEETIRSLTPLALQRHWRTPQDFPKCPEEIAENPLSDYGTNLECGCIFSQSEYGSESYVDTYELSLGGKSLSLINNIKGGAVPWAVAEVIFEDGKFIHIGHGQYFDFEGARKMHYKIIGRPWDGGDTFDDYC